jgi:hypothetical protein
VTGNRGGETASDDRFDELFRPKQPREWLPIEYDLLSAERRLVRRWRHYAEQYERSHGVAREE